MASSLFDFGPSQPIQIASGPGGYQPRTYSSTRRTTADDESWWDVTWGAMAGGFVNMASALSRRAGHLLNDVGDTNNVFDNWGDYLEQVKNDHPEWNPIAVDNAWDVITNPKALTQRIFSGLPMAASQFGIQAAGLALAPFTGGVSEELALATSAAIAYGVEGQSAYDEAVAHGASNMEAEGAAETSGVVNAIIQTKIPFTQFRFGDWVYKQIGWKAAGAALGQIESRTIGSVAKRFAQEIGIQATYGIGQGFVHDASVILASGDSLGGPQQFIDRRIQDAIGGAAQGLVTAPIFGAVPLVTKRVISTAMGNTSSAEPVFRSSFVQDQLQALGMDEADAKSATRVANSVVNDQDRQGLMKTLYSGLKGQGEVQGSFVAPIDEALGAFDKYQAVYPTLPDKMTAITLDQTLSKGGLSDTDKAMLGFNKIDPGSDEASKEVNLSAFNKTVMASRSTLDSTVGAYMGRQNLLTINDINRQEQAHINSLDTAKDAYWTKLEGAQRQTANQAYQATLGGQNVMASLPEFGDEQSNQVGVDMAKSQMGMQQTQKARSGIYDQLSGDSNLIVRSAKKKSLVSVGKAPEAGVMAINLVNGGLAEGNADAARALLGHAIKSGYTRLVMPDGVATATAQGLEPGSGEYEKVRAGQDVNFPNALLKEAQALDPSMQYSQTADGKTILALTPQAAAEGTRLAAAVAGGPQASLALAGRGIKLVEQIKTAKSAQAWQLFSEATVDALASSGRAAAIEKLIGKPWTQWTAEDTARVSTDFSKFVATGVSPNLETANAFNGLRKVAAQAALGYRSANPIQPLEMQHALSELFQPDTMEVQAKRQHVQSLLTSQSSAEPGGGVDNNALSTLAEAKWRALGYPQGMADEIYDAARYELSVEKGDKKFQGKLDQALQELSDLTSTQYEYTKPATQRFDDNPELQSLLYSLSDDEHVARTRFQSMGERVTNLVSMSYQITRTEFGRFAVRLGDMAETYERSIVGKFDPTIRSVVKGLSRADNRWLQTTDGAGITNYRKLLEQGLAAPNPRVQKLYDLHNAIYKFLGDQAYSNKMMVTLNDGWTVPFMPGKQVRMNRALNQDAFGALQAGAGPLFEAMRSAIIALNPHLENVLSGEYGPQRLRKFFGIDEKAPVRYAAFDQTRKLEQVPDVVMVNGSPKPIYHSDPYQLLNRQIQLQAKRIGMVKYFGYGPKLRNVTDVNIRSMARNLGVEFPITEGYIQNKLDEAGVGYMPDLSIRDLKAAARDADIDVRPSREDLIREVRKVNPNNMDPEQQASVLAMAKKLGGIAYKNRDFNDIYIDVMSRVEYPVTDVLEELRKGHIQQGGSASDFNDMLRVMQGLPYGWRDRNGLTRTLKLGSDILGAAQTSLTAIPHYLQPLQLAGVVGLKNIGKLLEARNNFLLDPDTTINQAVAMGGMRDSGLTWSIERGFFSEGVGRNIKQAASVLTGTHYARQRISAMNAETFRLVADGWSKNGIQGSDNRLAKMMGFSPDEITRINDGGMTPEDQARAVQRGVGMTQHVSEFSHRKGQVENVPLLGMIFNYFNYTAGQTRLVGGMIRDLGDSLGAIKRGDEGGIRMAGASMAKLAGYAAVLGGVGYAGILMRNAFKFQKPFDDDESLLAKAHQGLMEVGFYGATQRLMDPMKYGNSDSYKVMVGISPQLTAVAELMSAIKGWGKFGNFPAQTRADEYAKTVTPAYRAFWNWAEKVAWPSTIQYENSRSLLNGFRTTTLGLKPGSADDPVNPTYWPMFMAAKHDELDDARKLSEAYYKEALGKGVNYLDAKDDLRQSLLARAPIALSAENQRRLRDQLAEDDWAQMQATQHQYMSVVNAIAPPSGHAGRRFRAVRVRP